MALIFLGVPVFLTFPVSSFIKSNGYDFIADNEWSPIHPTSITGLSGLGKMVEFYYKLQPKLKQFPNLQMHFS